MVPVCRWKMLGLVLVSSQWLVSKVVRFWPTLTTSVMCQRLSTTHQRAPNYMPPTEVLRCCREITTAAACLLILIIGLREYLACHFNVSCICLSRVFLCFVSWCFMMMMVMVMMTWVWWWVRHAVCLLSMTCLWCDESDSQQVFVALSVSVCLSLCLCHPTYLGVTLDHTLSYREHLTKTEEPK